MNKRNFLAFFAFGIFILLSACGVKTNKTNATPSTTDKIEVQLKGKVVPDQILGAYQKYGLELIEVIDKSSNLWLFTFDEKTIEPNAMLKILKNSQFASGAKFHQSDNY